MSWDYFLFLKINSLVGQSGFFDGLAVFLAQYLPYLMILGAAVFFIFQVWKKWGWKWLWVAFWSLFLSRAVLAEISRLFWRRSRPFVVFPEAKILLSHSLSSSFPSGHASLFFALSAAIYLANKKIGRLFFGLSFLMGLARVFVGVHYLSDILAGLAAGVVSVWLANIIVSFFKR